MYQETVLVIIFLNLLKSLSSNSYSKGILKVSLRKKQQSEPKNDVTPNHAI